MIQSLDASLLEVVQPQEVKAYLESRGWVEHDQIGEKASIWIQTCEDGDEFEILLPLQKELKDYSLSLFNLVETLGVAEQRPEIEILNSLLNYSSDVLQVRINTPKTIYGKLPFNEGLKFYHSVKNLVVSSAQATIKPEAYFEKNSSEVDRYLEDLQMGHERGSYILDIISPIKIPTVNQTTLNLGQELDFSPEPFARRTMKQLARALQIVKNIAERVSSNEINLDYFSEVVSEGISANFCEAIVGINKSGECNGVDIKLKWSPVIRIGDDVPTSIFISRNIIHVIESAAQKLKSIYEENFELRGMVVELHRLPETRTGKVIVRLEIDDKTREVAIQLQDEDYEIAVQAHGQKTMIVCSGELSKEGKTFKLLNPRNLSIAFE